MCQVSSHIDPDVVDATKLHYPQSSALLCLSFGQRTSFYFNSILNCRFVCDIVITDGMV